MDLFGSLKDKLKQYVDLRLELFQLSAEQKLVELAASVVFWSITLFFALVGYAFAMLFFANILNQVLESAFWGYGIVALLSIFTSAVFLLPILRKSIEAAVRNHITEKINKQKDGNESPSSL